MSLYAVTMYMEAKNKTQALDDFTLTILSGEYNRDDLEVKDVSEELETGWDEEMSEWDDEEDWECE